MSGDRAAPGDASITAFGENRVDSIFQTLRAVLLSNSAASFALGNFLRGVSPVARSWRFFFACASLLASFAAAAQVADSQAPTVPAGLAATAPANGIIQLTWNAATDNVAVTQYTLYRNAVQFDAPVVWPAGTACTTDTSTYPASHVCFNAGNATYTYPDYFLDPATTYGYTVAACDAAGNCSAQSAAAVVATLPGPPACECPPVPMLVAVAVSSTQINVLFSYVARGTVQLKLYRDGTLLTSSAQPSYDAPYTDTAVAAATRYSYTAAQCDAAGNCSPQSYPYMASTPPASAEPDVLAPSVPDVRANPESSTAILVGWSPSSDKVGVSAYRVFRDGALQATLPAPRTSFADSGLPAATNYTYTVAACDLAGNCSAQSAPALATTKPAFVPKLAPGWNLLGHSLGTWVNVVTVFGNPVTPVAGITENVITVWKWNAALGRWAFYSPRLTYPANVAYAASHNYELLGTINPAEGYWVNAINPIKLPEQSGGSFNWRSSASLYSYNFGALPAGFNLIATSDDVTPSQFNLLVSQTAPLPGAIPSNNFSTLWAWEASKGAWYFYAPSLDASGGHAAVKDYADSHGYLHFGDYNKILGVGTGFWVNKL